MEKNTSPFKQYTSIYLEDYTWPRTVPVKNKPFQPPVRTGVRLFCAEPDSRICKPQTSCYGDYKTPNITLVKFLKNFIFRICLERSNYFSSKDPAVKLKIKNLCIQLD